MSKPFSFNFGSSSTSAGSFGSTNTSQPTSQPTGLFGNTSTTQPSTQSSGLFGSSATTPAPTSFGFGKPASTTGAQQSTGLNTTFTGFGTKPATTGTSLFGTSASANPSTGFSFGSTTQPSTSTSLFGGSTQIGGLFGSTQQKPATSFFSTTTPNLATGPTQPAQTAIVQQDAFLTALVNPQVFNDERDAVLAKWNQLQAFYGFGKMFYQNSSLDVTKDNQLCRFKTIGYSCKPTSKNEDGLIALQFNKKESDVKNNQKNIVDGLHKIFNSDASLTVQVESVKSLDTDKCELIFYVKQRVSQMSEQFNRIPALKVFEHLNKQEAPTLGGLRTSQTIKQQLEQLNVVNMYPLVGLSDEEIKNYLENPPVGLNPVLWDQANKNNPNPKKLMPVQINGFQEINKRFNLQEKENSSQKDSLNYISESIEKLNSGNKLLKTKIDQFKSRNEDLEQRMLKVMINYEIRRKIGLPLQENEKYLLNVLDSFQMELNSPINKEIQRQKLNEFIDIIKSFEYSNRANPLKTSSNFVETIGANNLSEIQKSLKEQQKAFKSLIEIVNQDLKDLEIVKKDLGIKL
ncbi:nucleoporin p54 isoform X2 [Brachionus plicatilis]|uniref:Nucleoporin p54 isoform X2 n=1 Tax=Brachionus plicatilis TaxID=10195 RepID=A0A3M7SYU9_BRAPC|nr:nucleoporin p54 isoform X2 [Brachionus plicatilis]